MTAQPEPERPATPTPTKRARSASESLLAIVLGLEAALIFFVTVTAFGLKVVPAGIAWAGGAVLIILFLLVARVVRHDWGVRLGWALQAVLIALGFLMPLMFFIGAGFVALWLYCFIAGRRLDARNQQLAAAGPSDTHQNTADTNTADSNTADSNTAASNTAASNTAASNTADTHTKEKP